MVRHGARWIGTALLAGLVSLVATPKAWAQG